MKALLTRFSALTYTQQVQMTKSVMRNVLLAARSWYDTYLVIDHFHLLSTSVFALLAKMHEQVSIFYAYLKPLAALQNSSIDYTTSKSKNIAKNPLDIFFE